MIISRLAPRAGGGWRWRRSIRARLSRPIWTERCSSNGSRREGGFGGSGGISWSARRGETGAGGAGVETWRYHGIESELVEVGG